MIRRFLAYFRPHLPSILLAFLCMGAVSFSLGCQVFLIRNVLDEVLIRHDRALLALLPLAVIGLYGLQAAAEVGRGFLLRRVGQGIKLELRQELFEHYQRLPIEYFQARSTGAVMARVMNDVEAVHKGVTVLITVVQKPLSLLVLIVAAAWQEPWLTLVALVGIPLVVFPVDRLSQQLRKHTQVSLEAIGRLNSILQESILGARIVRIFGMEGYEAQRFRDEGERHYRVALKSTLSLLLSGPIIQTVAAFGAAGILWWGGQRVMDGQSSPGSLLAFLVSLGLMNDPLKSLAKVPLLMSQTRVGIERVFEVLDTPAEAMISKAELAVLRSEGPEDRTVHTLRAKECDVEFCRVDFSYGDRPILHGVSLELRAGETVALVGPSGAGKTSLLNLLPRFYEISGGTIKINGIDIRDISLSSLRGHIAMVTQDSFLFNDSIRDNIAYGQPDRSMEEVREAARLADADDFIGGLPEGYETLVGDLGTRISGGQRQRIAIARALLKDAPILLLDEATSALDQESEVEVQRALERLMKSRTTLVVAHRLSTIRDADRIVVLDEGRVVEEGAHDALLDRGGLYARLYSGEKGPSRRMEPTSNIERLTFNVQ